MRQLNLAKPERKLFFYLQKLCFVNKAILATGFLLFATFTTTFSQQDSIKKQNRDSLVVNILRSRNVIFNFVNRTKLEPKDIQNTLEEAMKFIYTPEEIISMAYDPKMTRFDFDGLMEKGAKYMKSVLSDDIIRYNQVPKSMLDNEKYEKDKKAVKDSFEMNLKNENATWYDFYVVKNGVTEDWNKDRAMLNEILNCKSYTSYRTALDNARKRYEAPYYKIHQDLIDIRACLLLYNASATSLFMSYKGKGEIYRSVY